MTILADFGDALGTLWFVLLVASLSLNAFAAYKLGWLRFGKSSG